MFFSADISRNRLGASLTVFRIDTNRQHLLISHEFPNPSIFIEDLRSNLSLIALLVEFLDFLDDASTLR